MKTFKTLLVLTMALGLLAGCSGINVHPINFTEPMVHAVLVTDPVPDEPKLTKIRNVVLFDFDSAILDTKASATVDKVADLMKQYPDTDIALQGHTDKYGSDDYNIDLSIKRAEAVKDALMRRGIDEERIIEAVGFGKQQLLKNVTNRENRRVLILSVGE